MIMFGCFHYHYKNSFVAEKYWQKACEIADNLDQCVNPDI